MSEKDDMRLGVEGQGMLFADKAFGYMDRVILYCFMGLVLILPVAHTVSLRAALILIPAALWCVKMVKARRWLFGRTPLDIPLLLFFIAVAVSITTSLKPSVSMDELRGEFLTYTLLFYMAAFSFHDDSRRLDLVKVLLFGSLIMAIYGIWEFFSNQTDIFSIRYRAGSLHQGYEAYAQYLITLIPFNILAFFHWRRPGQRAALSVVLLLNLFALFLTHTRGGWVAMWVELFVLAVLLPRKKAVKAVLVALLFVLPAAGLKVLPAHTLWHGSEGLSVDAERQDNSGNIRLVHWKGALEGLAREPFTPAGYGKANFKRRFEHVEYMNLEQAHNTFINTAVQLGVQGLAVLIFIIIVVLRTSWKVWKGPGDGPQRLLGLSVFVMTIGFFTANQFAEFYIDDSALMFWLLVGMVVSIRNGGGGPGAARP